MFVIESNVGPDEICLFLFVAGTGILLECHFIKSESDDFTDTTFSMDIGDESTSACIMDTFVASDGLLVMT